MIDTLVQSHPHLQTSLDAYRHLRQRLDTPPQVVVCGMLKSGKSSLLNALSDRDDEYFAVGAVRETVAVKRLQHEGLVWIDTPGIDAPNEDIREAWKGLVEADLFLFVHSLESGALEVQEKDFLDDLRRVLPDVHERLLPVWSKRDVLDGESQRVAEALQTELERVLGQRPLPPAIVSAKRYQTGRRKGKALLVEKSAIPALREAVSGHVARCAKGRSQRLQALWQVIDEALLQAIAQRRKNHQALSQRRRAQEAELQADLDHFAERLQARIKHFERQYR